MKNKKAGHWKIIIGLLLGAGFLLFLIRNFLLFQDKACSSAIGTNLFRIYEAQTKYHQINGAYASHSEKKRCFELLNWEPSCGKRTGKIDYYCDTDVWRNRNDPKSCSRPRLYPITNQGFTAVAVENVDNDPDCRVRIINDTGTITEIRSD